MRLHVLAGYVRHEDIPSLSTVAPPAPQEAPAAAPACTAAGAGGTVSLLGPGRDFEAAPRAAAPVRPAGSDSEATVSGTPRTLAQAWHPNPVCDNRGYAGMFCECAVLQ